MSATISDLAFSPFNFNQYPMIFINERWQPMLSKNEIFHRIEQDQFINYYEPGTLDLSNSQLNNLDIQQLAEALKSNHYITTLNLANNNFSTLGELIYNTNITSLDVSYNNLNDTEVATLAKNTTLTHLEIAHNPIGEMGAYMLLTLNKNLKTLNISDNIIGTDLARYLADNKTLTHLKISQTQLGDTKLVELINENANTIIELVDHPIKIPYENWKKIVLDIQTNQYTESHLELSGLNLHDLDIKQLTNALEKNDYVTSLSLDNNNINTLGELVHNTKITTLNVSHNHLNPAEATYLAKNKTLTHLEIADNQIGPVGAYALLTQNKTLKTLNILNNKISLDAIHFIQKNTTLVHLKVSGSEIGPVKVTELIHPDSQIVEFDNGMKKISYDIFEKILFAIKSNQYTDSHLELSDLNLNDLDIKQLTHALETNTYISSLNLQNNDIGTLGALIHNTRLKSLNVSNNYLNTSEVSILAQNKILTHLDIAHNNLGTDKFIDSAIALLSTNPNLTYLNISHNRITAENLLTLVEHSQVKHLSIGGNFLDPLVLKTLRTNTVLQSLDVSSNLYSNGTYNSHLLRGSFNPESVPWSYKFSYTGDVTIYLPLTHIETLENLDISYNQGIPLNSILITELTNMPALMNLNLSHTLNIGKSLEDVFLDSQGEFYAYGRELYSGKTSTSQILAENIKLIATYDAQAYPQVNNLEHTSILEWIKAHPELDSSNIFMKMPAAQTPDILKSSLSNSHVFSSEDEINLLETSHIHAPITLAEIKLIATDSFSATEIETNTHEVSPYFQIENVLAVFENSFNIKYE